MIVLPARKSYRRALAVLALAVFLPVAAPAWAQHDEFHDPIKKNIRAERETSRESTRKARQAENQAKADRKNRKGTTQAEDATPPLYPMATRQQPEGRATRGGMKGLQALAEAFQAGDDDVTIAAALAITGNPESNDYEKAFAYQIAGSAASNKNDEAAAADYFAKALAADALSNNDHYSVMFNLAVVEYGLEQYPQALATLDRFFAETKSDRLEARNLRGGVLMALERYDDAAALYSGLLAEHPENKMVRMNAVAAYQQGDKADKAVELLADANDKGLLTEPNEYQALYVSYMNADRDKEAAKVIEDGLAKGVIKPSPELARAYMVLGQNAYYADDRAAALKMYKQAASMANNGEAALNLAKIYAEDGRKAEAKAAAQEALEKGVKDTAGAKRLAAGK